jgi:hypothetical protein
MIKPKAWQNRVPGNPYPFTSVFFSLCNKSGARSRNESGYVPSEQKAPGHIGRDRARSTVDLLHLVNIGEMARGLLYVAVEAVERWSLPT